MSEKKVEALGQAEKAGLASSYAAMILADSDLPVNFDNLKKVVAASGLKVEDFFLRSFAGSLEGRNVKSMFVVSGGSDAAQAAPAKQAKGKEDKKEKKKEEPKPKAKEPEPEPEEEEMGMGDLFG